MNSANKEKGWVKIYRSLVSSNSILYRSLSNKNPMCEVGAWLDLLLSVNHAPARIKDGHKVIELKPGEVMTSTYKLSERWKWSRKQVMKFLNDLESEKMITKKSDHKRTIIFIINWGDYQGYDDEEKDYSGTTKELKQECKEYTLTHTQANFLKMDKPIDLLQVKGYAKVNGIREEVAEKFYYFYAGNGWMQNNGLPVADWRMKLLYWDKLEDQRNNSQGLRKISKSQGLSDEDRAWRDSLNEDGF